MNKYIAPTLILLVAGIVFTLEQCVTLGDVEEHMPASLSEYKIDPVANEVLLKRLYPDAEHSDCGLSDDEFIKYVRERIDFRRKFQFVVFIEGTTMTGKRCLKRAFLFYLK